jgi:hypothetical protein
MTNDHTKHHRTPPPPLKEPKPKPKPVTNRLTQAYSSSDGEMHASLLDALESDLTALFGEIEKDCGGLNSFIVAYNLLKQPLRSKVEAILKELQ